MVQQIVVASIQTQPKLLDVRANLANALQLTFEASAKGARVIVLPELCTSGFVLRSSREAADCAQDKNGYMTEMFMSITNRFNCHVVFGYVESCRGNLYNSAAIVGPHGLEANVQKHNLFGPDAIWAESSEQVFPTVITEAGRLGALICSDITNKPRQSFPGNVEAPFYHKGSVDTIALLTSWGGRDYAYPDAEWVNLGESLDCNVIVSNRVGKERDMEFKGGSAVISRDKNIYTHGSNFVSEAVVGGLALL